MCRKPLSRNLGIDMSDEALRRAVEKQNKVNRLIMEFGKYRREEKPRITILKETLDELRQYVEELRRNYAFESRGGLV